MHTDSKKHDTHTDANNVLSAFARIKYWKPNLLQKLMYRIGLMKDPRYNGKKMDWVKYDELGQMNTNKEYKVLSHKFIGYGTDGSATYEITFNKSLEHTGRFKGIEDGLNDYCRKERAADVISNFKRLWFSLVRLIKK